MREHSAVWANGMGADSSTQNDTTKSYDTSLGGEVFFYDWIPALTWYPPKIDWTREDVINYDDFNAVEHDTETIRQYLNSISYEVPALTVKTNRDKTSIDYLSSINRIEQNLEAIRQNFVTPLGYLGSKTWEVGTGFDYNDANRLEKNVKMLMELGLLVYDNFRYCGTITCGDEWGLIY